MTRFLAMAALLLLAAWHAPAAQGQGVTVQLPTYRTFRVVTTVSVPDRGGAYLGGVGRAASARQRFAAPYARGGLASGSSRQSSGVHISATVHDHQQLDRALLGGSPGSDPSASPLAERLSTSRASMPLLSVSEARARQRSAEQAQQTEAAAFLQRGLDATAAGKTAVARIHLQMAARRAGGELKQRVLAELKQLDERLAAHR